MRPYERLVKYGVDCVTLNPLSSGKTLYTASAEISSFMRSDDYGKTWNYYRLDPGNLRRVVIRQIVCFEEDTACLLAVTSDVGLWRSSNGGQTWNLVIAKSGILGENVAYKPGLNRIFFGRYFRGPIYYSDDRGLTWHVQVDWISFVNLCSMEISRDGKTLLAGSGFGKIARSQDDGKTWQIVYEPENDYPLDPEIPKILFLDSPSSTAYATRWLSRKGIVKTTDRGDTWTTLANPSRFLWALERDETKRILWTAVFNEMGLEDRECIFESIDDGLTWSPIFKYRLEQVWMLKVDRHNGVLYAATDMGLFKLRV